MDSTRPSPLHYQRKVCNSAWTLSQTNPSQTNAQSKWVHGFDADKRLSFSSAVASCMIRQWIFGPNPTFVPVSSKGNTYTHETQPLPQEHRIKTIKNYAFGTVAAKFWGLFGVIVQAAHQVTLLTGLCRKCGRAEILRHDQVKILQVRQISNQAWGLTQER